MSIETEPQKQGSDSTRFEAALPPLKIGRNSIRSRLIMGSGRYDSFEIMKESLVVAECDAVTMAVRREKLHDSSSRNILDFLELDRYLILPNTAGCYDAETAVRCARMGREILKGLEHPGQDWVKLEVLGDSRTLLPDPVETLEATAKLVADGFDVLVYTSDDPILAKRLKEAGAAAVMPAASPIGSGLGILNPNSLLIILDSLKSGDATYPVIIDAGIGTASDACRAMELGFDAVLLNSAVARADDPIMMAKGMCLAVKSGRMASLGGRIPAARFGSASSPEFGVISDRNGSGSGHSLL